MRAWSRGALRTAATAATAVLGVVACGRSSAPGPVQLLDPAAQHAAAQKVARAFVEVCLTAPDALAATRTLENQGWPRFGVVWKQPDSVFYAAKPSPASPAGLFVIGDRRLGEGRLRRTAVSQIICVGHYPADEAIPMVQAIERRWGPSREGPRDRPASREWAYRMKNGVLAAAPLSEALGRTAAASSPAPGEALVYAQVFYNPSLHDVASLVSIRRPAA